MTALDPAGVHTVGVAAKVDPANAAAESVSPLMFSTLLLFGGTIADRIGARAAYRDGMLLFVAASMACGLAPSPLRCSSLSSWSPRPSRTIE